MKYNIIKYYKYTVKSLMLSKYFLFSTVSLNNCNSFSLLILKKSRVLLCNVVCGFIYYYLTGVRPSLRYVNVFKGGKKRKKYKFIGCHGGWFKDWKFLFIFLLSRRLTISKFLGSYNLQKKHSGIQFYKLIITNFSYILRRPAFSWENFMFYDIFLTNNFRVVYLLRFFSFWSLKMQFDWLRLCFF